jgi:hypothetical protein
MERPRPGPAGTARSSGYYVDASGDNRFIYSGGTYTTLVGTETVGILHTQSRTKGSTGVNTQSEAITVSIVPDRTARQLPGLSLRRLERRRRRDSRRGSAINRFQSANNYDSVTARIR